MKPLLLNPLYRDQLQAFTPSLPLQVRGKRVLVTGAGGLIGSAVVDLLVTAGCECVYAAGRDINRVRMRFGEWGKTVRVVHYEATCHLEFAEQVDWVVHAASPAAPGDFMSVPVDTLVSNVAGVRDLVDYAVRHQVRKVVYVSSSEVYGITHSDVPLTEDAYGVVDPVNPRSCYAEAKRAAEALCVAAYRQMGSDVSIVRPGHIYGPTAKPTDGRVSSLFAYQAAQGQYLVLKSDGAQIRSYCHCLDCASAILHVAASGEAAQPYNVSNRDSVLSIRQMVEILARAGGVQVRFDIPKDEERQRFNPMSNSSLNAEKLERLGWRGQITADVGLSEMVQILRQLNR
jgi:nucleoside-diphosphate-sugar epimerase